MATWQEIITAAQTLLQRWKRDIDFTSQIVNGPATGPASVVNTDGGTIPTFAKTLGDAAVESQSLRSDLANATDPAKGAALVGAQDGASGSLWATVAGFIAKIISSSGASAIGFLQAGADAVVRTVRDKLRDQLDGADYGIAADGVADDATKINALIAQAPANAIITLRGTIKANSSIVMRTGIKVVLRGTLNAGSQTNVIDFTGINNAEWDGGFINGDATTNGQNGFNLTNASGNRITPKEIAGCKNKAISIIASTASSQVSRDNFIGAKKVSGSNSTTGAGLSIFGDGCEHNTVDFGYYTGNRLGITINGSHRNTINRPDCSGNSDAGIMIDGVVTDSGDGGKYNKIIAPVCNSNSPSTLYGGIYLGNGSSYNEIIAPTCKNNAGAGIRTSATQGTNDCFSNHIIAPVCEANASSGIALSASAGTKLIAPIAISNTGRGIDVFKSDYTTISQPECRLNTQQGILIQSGYTKVTGGGRVAGNDVGYQVTTGGSTDTTNNLIDGVHVAGNTTGDFSIDAGRGRFVNCTGNPPAVKTDIGDANFTAGPGTPGAVIANTPLTAVRSITLITTGSVSGDRIRVKRTAAATGASALNVGTGPLKALAAGQWCEVEFNGTTWELMAFGSL